MCLVMYLEHQKQPPCLLRPAVLGVRECLVDQAELGEGLGAHNLKFTGLTQNLGQL